MARVLVIDDDDAVRQTIKIILEGAGHAAMLADSGETAATYVAAFPFDIVIVDIFMPGIDGIETIGLIGRHAPDLHVIAMSGAAFAGAAEARGEASDFFNIAVGLGASYCLHKPFGARELLALIDTCCAQRDRATSKVA